MIINSTVKKDNYCNYNHQFYFAKGLRLIFRMSLKIPIKYIVFLKKKTDFKVCHFKSIPFRHPEGLFPSGLFSRNWTLDLR